MIKPLQWKQKRPGITIPVFFLSLCPIFAQWHSPGTLSAALGGTRIMRTSYCDAAHNQANLGIIKRHSVSLHHAQPYLSTDLAFSSLALQWQTRNGGLGLSLSSYGIKGFRHTSMWLGYGLPLSKSMTAGIGIHYWSASIREKIIFHPGLGCAMGLRIHLNEKLSMGLHVQHPLSWSHTSNNQVFDSPVLSTGAEYIIFQTITIFSEIRYSFSNGLQIHHGIALRLKDRVDLMIGYQNLPRTLSAGLSVQGNHWIVQIASRFITETGITPHASVIHAW
jgi:hypothetical protein